MHILKQAKNIFITGLLCVGMQQNLQAAAPEYLLEDITPQGQQFNTRAANIVILMRGIEQASAQMLGSMTANFILDSFQDSLIIKGSPIKTIVFSSMLSASYIVDGFLIWMRLMDAIKAGVETNRAISSKEIFSRTFESGLPLCIGSFITSCIRTAATKIAQLNISRTAY